MKRLAALVVPLACLSCMGPSTEEQAQIKTESNRAMNAFVRHAFEQVAGIDDKISDARTIALALTNACAVEYNAYTQAQAALCQTAKGRNLFWQIRNSDSEKIQASLQIVLMYRAGKLPKG